MRNNRHFKSFPKLNLIQKNINNHWTMLFQAVFARHTLILPSLKQSFFFDFVSQAIRKMKIVSWASSPLLFFLFSGFIDWNFETYWIIGLAGKSLLSLNHSLFCRRGLLRLETSKVASNIRTFYSEPTLVAKSEKLWKLCRKYLHTCESYKIRIFLTYFDRLKISDLILVVTNLNITEEDNSVLETTNVPWGSENIFNIRKY